MNKIKVKLSQQWQVPQKPDKNGKQYPPLVEKLEVELDSTIEQLAETYTMLNAEFFKARVSHMKGLKQRSAVNDYMKESGW
jgi:predicted DNA-binding ArsR family transcriptional regulator